MQTHADLSKDPVAPAEAFATVKKGSEEATEVAHTGVIEFCYMRKTEVDLLRECWGPAEAFPLLVSFGWKERHDPEGYALSRLVW